MESISWNNIVEANRTISTIDVKGKQYAQVNQRVKAFRTLYPEGTIKTDILSMDNGVVVIRAEIFNGDKLLASGTAYEKEGSSQVNSTSYIENCETSAVGRALGMCGLGIDVSIASADEVSNAIHQQEVEEKKKEKEKKDKAMPTIMRIAEIKHSFENAQSPEVCKGLWQILTTGEKNSQQVQDAKILAKNRLGLALTADEEWRLAQLGEKKNTTELIKK